MKATTSVTLRVRFEKLGNPYKIYVGDRDSALFNAVMEMSNGEGPYSVPVEKRQ